MRPSPPDQNGILASLPAPEYKALLPELEWVQVPNGLHLDEFGGPVEHVYFPTQGIVSLVYTNDAGECSEVAVVGREAMCGVTSFLAGHADHHRALVRAPCFAYRLPARRLRTKFLEGGVLQRLLLAYTECLLLQISVIAICNRHHTLEKQLCRWLLQSLDRVSADELPATQELVALLLGVRRQGITEAVRRLDERGLIAWARGMIRVTNYEGLLANACPCYDVLRRDMQDFRQNGNGAISAQGARRSWASPG